MLREGGEDEMGWDEFKPITFHIQPICNQYLNTGHSSYTLQWCFCEARQMPSYAISDINQGTAVKLQWYFCETCKMLVQVLLPITNLCNQSVPSTIIMSCTAQTWHHSSSGVVLHRPDINHPFRISDISVSKFNIPKYLWKWVFCKKFDSWWPGTFLLIS